MKIGILGSGDVGKAIGKGFVTLGHSVLIGSREANNPKGQSAAVALGHGARATTFGEAVSEGELIVLATLGTAVEQAIAIAKSQGGADHFDGKLVWDTTNPLDSSGGFPPKLVGALGTSGGEKVQA